MIRSVFLVALALGCVSAQNRWPMITVNAAGEIVLQSLTRAQAFQITPTAVTTGPASGTTASLTTVTALAAGVSAYDVTAATSFATNHGVALPTVTLGASVTLYQKASTIVSYVIWSQTSNFINADSSQQSFVVEATARRVTCTGVSATRWNCVTDFAGANSAVSTGRAITISTSAVNTASGSYTLTAANILGGYHVATPGSSGTTTTITFDSASNIIAAANTASSLTDSYEITIQNAYVEVVANIANSYIITLAAGTGITIPSDGTQILVPGHTRTYLVYRTGSSTYSVVLKNSFKKQTITSPIVCSSNFGAATQAATTAAAVTAAATCNANYVTVSVITGTSTVGILGWTINNAHARLGMIVSVDHIAATGQSIGNAANALGGTHCAILSDGVITCHVLNAAYNSAVSSFSLNVIVN